MLDTDNRINLAERCTRLMSLLGVFAATAFLFLPITSYAQQGTLTDDAYFDPTGNNVKVLVVQGANSGPAAAFIKFKITGTTPGVIGSLPSGTPGSSVARATLKLFVQKVTNGGTLDVFRVTSAWTENAASAPTYDTTSPVAAGLQVATAAAGSFVTIDLTALVQQWLGTDGAGAGGVKNFGIALAASANKPNTDVSFDSKETTTTSHLAQLDIVLNHAATADTAASFAGPLAGDVTGTQNATVVSSVGGRTAASAASAIDAANGAKSTNTANAIVKRDVAGNFSAGTITASLNGNASMATNAISFTGNLGGDVTGPQSATVVTSVGGRSATQVAGATDAANGATSTNTANATVKRDASGNFSAGAIAASLNGNATSATIAATASSLAANATVSGSQITGTLTNATLDGSKVTGTVANATNAITANHALTADAATTATTASTVSVPLNLSGTGNVITVKSSDGTGLVGTGGPVTGGANLAFPTQTGVFGTGDGNGVVGTSTGYGVPADLVGAIGNGVMGYSDQGNGVFGSSAQGNAVFGNSANGTGIYGKSTNGKAGLFDGNVTINGNLTLTGNTNISASVNHDSTLSGNGTAGSPLAVESAPNGVVTTGTYPNPTWITSLDGSKVTGTVANATNAVNATTASTVSVPLSLTSSGNAPTVQATNTGAGSGGAAFLGRSSGGEPTVQGISTTVGGGAGVLGTAIDRAGTGVFGENLGGGVAVLGRTGAGGGNALEGRSSSATGNALFAYNDGFGTAVYGASPNGLAGRFDGVVTINGGLNVSGTSNLNLISSSNAPTVQANNTGGGAGGGGAAFLGRSNGGEPTVQGISTTVGGGAGVLGTATDHAGTGIIGENFGGGVAVLARTGTGGGNALEARSSSATGNALFAYNDGFGTAVYGASPNGLAGRFDGPVTVNGNLTVSGSTNISPSVNHDSTLSGNGTTGSPLAVVSAPNGVVTTGSYANPLWITSLDGSKITTGTAVKSVNGLADSVTLAAGSNVTITPSGNTLTIASAATVPKVNPQQVALLRWYEARSGISFPVGINPQEMAFDGSNIWVVNAGANSMTKFSANDGTVLGTYPVGNGPNEVLFDGANVWVCNISGSITKLRASDGAFLATIPTDKPTGLTFDGTFIWVANNNSGTLTKIRASDGTTTVAVGPNGNPYKMAFDGTLLWYTLPFHGAVCKVNPVNGNTGCLDLGSNAQGLAFDGTNMWVALYGDNVVKKIRVSDAAIVGSYAVGSGPNRVVFDGVNIWVSCTGSNTVTKLRASDGSNLGNFPTGSSPVGIVFDGANVWVSNSGDNTISKF